MVTAARGESAAAIWNTFDDCAFFQHFSKSPESGDVDLYDFALLKVNIGPGEPAAQEPVAADGVVPKSAAIAVALAGMEDEE